MSCSSPFLFQEGLTIISTNNCVVSGEYSLNGYSYSYTVPSACVPIWTCSWWGGCTLDSCAWKTLSYSETIVLWPTINISVNTTLPITTTSSAGIQMTEDPPETAYVSTTVSAGNFTISLDVNGTITNILIKTDNIQLEQNNDEFSVNIPLASVSNTINNDAGIDYTITISPIIQFCLDPVPPVGWINLVLQCTLEASDPTIDYSYTVNFAVSVPIVSVEEKEGGE